MRSNPPTRSPLVAAMSLMLLAACASANARNETGPLAPPVSQAPGPATSSPSSTHQPGTAYGFLVVGDFGSKDAEEAKVAFAAEHWVARRPFDAFVTLGDNVYESGNPADFHAAWTVPYGWVDQAHVPVIVSLGNHDVETQDGTPEIKFFHLPGHYYSRRVGPVEFFVLDANAPFDSGQKRWIAHALAVSTAPWKVVVFHQPAFSCGRHQSDPDVQRAWVGLFAREHVNLVVNGHDHDYQRFAPMNGVTYVVSGGGGRELYAIGSCPAGTPKPVVSNDSVHEFLYLRLTPKLLRARAVSSNGTTVDSFSLNAPGA